MKEKQPTGQADILLLEDDPNLGFILQEHLQMQGYSVHLYANGIDGLKASRAGQFALYLVDVMMPRMDGFTFAKTVRMTDQRTPVIFLTAKSLKEDKIEGFKIGCDDYVTKPFSMEELMLRIQAVLRRVGNTHAAEDVLEAGSFSFGKCTLDPTTQRLTVGSTEQKLTGREAELLRLLYLHRNRVLDRDMALKTLWGTDSFFAGRSMDVFISRLRKRLAGDESVQILNVHGKGFKLVVSDEERQHAR